MNIEVRLGDCLDVLATLPNASIDAVVTDPPYGIDLQPQRGLRDLTRAIANDTREVARVLWRRFVPEAWRVAKPNTAHLFFGGWSEVWAKDVLAEHFTVKGCIVWKKNLFGLGYYLRPQHELAWYCHKGSPPRPAKAESDVWEFRRVMAPKHSCQKPVELIRKAVRFTCPPGGTVLDPFAGSGTTGVACVMEDRNFIGVECDASYVETSRARIAAAQAQLPLFGAA